jgi:hypothetical protein
VEAWANVNNFLALLAATSYGSTADPNRGQLLHFGARLLRQTLELPLPNWRLELNLPAAITWMLSAGRVIYANLGLRFIAVPVTAIRKVTRRCIGDPIHSITNDGRQVVVLFRFLLTVSNYDRGRRFIMWY